MPEITIIDDEVQIATLLSEIGEMAGYETKFYTEARHFLKDTLPDGKTNKKDADILFLDLSMPDIDGIEVISELGKRQCQSSIFLMSGFDSELLNSAKHIAVEYGLKIVETVNKPMDIGYITGRLKELKDSF